MAAFLYLVLIYCDNRFSLAVEVIIDIVILTSNFITIFFVFHAFYALNGAFMILFS